MNIGAAVENEGLVRRRRIQIRIRSSGFPFNRSCYITDSDLNIWGHGTNSAKGKKWKVKSGFYLVPDSTHHMSLRVMPWAVDCQRCTGPQVPKHTDLPATKLLILWAVSYERWDDFMIPNPDRVEIQADHNFQLVWPKCKIFSHKKQISRYLYMLPG